MSLRANEKTAEVTGCHLSAEQSLELHLLVSSDPSIQQEIEAIDSDPDAQRWVSDHGDVKPILCAAAIRAGNEQLAEIIRNIPDVSTDLKDPAEWERVIAENDAFISKLRKKLDLDS